MSNTASDAKRKTKAAPGEPAKPYHHGALHESILRAAEDILEREGIEGLTLRAAARAAGVSHAAPKNHFDDLTGLLSELAALGFKRLGEALMRAANDAPESRLIALGRAYVGYAHAHPGMFLLMFRSERLDMERPALRNAALAARGALAGEIMARVGGAAGAGPLPEAGAAGPPALSLEETAGIVSAWSLVHGFSMLLIDHRLDPVIRALAPTDNWQTLLDAVFVSMQSQIAKK